MLPPPVENKPTSAVTQLLQQWQAGDPEALNTIMPLLYAELRTIAARVMRSGAQRGTLQPTVIVHEAYLRLAGVENAPRDRAHFLALAATAMRHVVLDWAKSKTRDKRGAGVPHETLKESFIGMDTDPLIVLEVDRLLSKLSGFDERKARIVEMIFFAGLTYDEAASVTGVSAVTVHRELKMAKAWMRAEMTANSAA